MSQSSNRRKCANTKCLCGDGRYKRKVAIPSMLFENNLSSGDDFDFLEILQRSQQELREYDPLAKPLTEKIVNRANKELDEIRLKPKITPAKFDLDEISIGGLLGTGGFSNVFEIISLNAESKNKYTKAEEEARSNLMASCKKSGRERVSPYALKQLRRKLMENTKKFSNGAIDLTLEAAFLSSLDHPHLLKIHGVAANGPEGYLTGRHDGYYLIVDRLSETLQDRVKKWRKRFKRLNSKLGRLLDKQGKKSGKLMEERLKVAFDIASALNYLHARRLVYRDLKPSNIGFCPDNILKLFDFGLCRELPEGAGRSMDAVFDMSGGVGTYRYMSPEVAKREKYNQGADVFSFGMVLYEILSLNVPSVQKDSKTVDADQLRLCHCWPEAVKQLLFRTWSPEIASRPTMQEVSIVLKKAIVQLRGGGDADLLLPDYDEHGNKISEKLKRFQSIRLNDVSSWTGGSTESLHHSVTTAVGSQRALGTTISTEFSAMEE